jgi:hypothetical protein
VGLLTIDGRFATSERRYSRSFVATGTQATLYFGDYSPHSTYVIDNVVAAVPEPATWAMMLIGFGGIGSALRRRKVKPAVQFA